MLEIVLHAGAEHPSALLILGPSLLSFLAGLGVGARAGRLRDWLRSRNTTTDGTKTTD